MTREELIQAARDFVVLATGLDDGAVIIAPANGPRPALPYASVQVTSTPSAGHDEELLTSTVADAEDDTYVTRRVGHRTALFDVNLYGSDDSDPFELAELVRDAVGTASMRAAARANGIGIMQASDVRDMSRLLDTKHEPRAMLELVVSWVRETTGAGDALASVEVSLDVESGNDVVDTVVAESP